MHKKIKKEYYRRVWVILKTELVSPNWIQVIDTLAATAVTYSFNIISWNFKDTKKIDPKIQKLLTCNRMHHPGADVQRLHVQRRERGRGLMQMKMTFKTSKIKPHKYLSTTNAWMLQLVLFYTGFHSIVMRLNKNFT